MILATACRGGNAPKSVEVSPARQSAAALSQSGSTRTTDGLRLRGETRFVGAESDAVEAAVALINPGPQPVRFRLGPCALRVQIHFFETGGGPPKWDSEQNRPAAEGAACDGGERWLELRSGNSASPKELRMRIPVRDVVGKAQFTVNYYFRAIVRLNGDSTEVPTGKLGLPKLAPSVETLEGLAFQAETRVVESEGSPKRLRTRVIVMNQNTRRVEVNYGDCSPQLRVYRHAHRSGGPIWYEGRLPGKDPKTGMLTRICDAYGLNDIINPGDSLVVQRFQLEPTVAEVLGDSLLKGRYFFTAVFRITGLRFQTSELPSGSAMLTR